MAKRKKKKIPKLTAEDHARFDANTRLIEERIAYHHAKALEEEAREQPKRG